LSSIIGTVGGEALSFSRSSGNFFRGFGDRVLEGLSELDEVAWGVFKDFCESCDDSV
jgi:hypothetical protein